jgi:hypothetical protein
MIPDKKDENENHNMDRYRPCSSCGHRSIFVVHGIS